MQYPTALEGCPLRVDVHAPDGSGPRYQRLLLICDKHRDCRKYRNVSQRQMASLGQREPLAYLAVWYLNGHIGQSAKEHNKMKPTMAAMRQWLAENP